MRFDGQWLPCDDGIARPVLRAEILANDGHWRAAELLVDTGADRTLLSANVLETLNFEAVRHGERFGGIGGIVETVTIATEIRLTRNDGGKAVFRGEFAACTDYEALDMSVLGRDVLEIFALIVDRKASVLALIGGRHGYTIQQR